MKKVILTALVASVSLMAAGNATLEEGGGALYMKKCSLCHGPDAKKTPIKNMKPIAGMKKEKIARILKFYQDDERIGHGYSENMVNSTVFLSQKAIDAIATYVSMLK